MKIYILPILFISPIITISCNSLFSIWMSMELNLMAFIPTLIFMNKFNKEISIKYFIIQTISSSMFLLFSNSIFMKISLNFFNEYSNLFINMSLLIKLGIAPFHSWFINMIKNLNWIPCLMLMTWQKIIPFIILNYFLVKYMMFISMILSCLIGAIYGLNHQSIRLIMGYSSINHMSWLMLNILISQYSWMIYFFSYSMINLFIILMMNKLKIYYLNQLFLTYQPMMFKLTLFFNLLSINGLPPMFGFIMKWFTVYSSTLQSFYIILINLMMISVINFIFYMRLTLTTLIFKYPSNKLYMSNKFFNLKYLWMMLPTMFLNLWTMNLWLL